jgi:hypothetical protein
MVDSPGRVKRPMTPDEIVMTLSKQQDEIKRLMIRVQELEIIIENNSKKRDYMVL